MATVTLTTASTRLNDGDSATGWGNYNASGGSPSSEAQNAYQGVTDVNKKITGSNDRGGVDYNHGTTVDMSTADRRIWVCKVYVTDYGDVSATFGVEGAIGSSEGNHWEYVLAGSLAKIPLFAEYPPEGGYIIAAIAPSASGWAENTVGSPSVAAVDFFAGGAQMIAGGAKAENVALSAIDVGAGLTYTGAFVNGLADGQAFDQGDKANGRFGFNRRVGGGLALIGRHGLGDGATACTGVDTGFRNWSDGYFGPGDAGLDVDLSVGAPGLTLAGTYTSDGAKHAVADTRADMNTLGEMQILLMPGTWNNWRIVALSPSTTVSGSIEADRINQNNAIINGATLRATAEAGSAMLVNPELALMTDVRFVQAGAGHGIELVAPGVYNIDQLRGLNADGGFGPDGALDAGVYNNSGGLVELQRLSSLTPAPTVRNGAGATTTLPAVQSAFIVSGVPAGAEIRIYDNEVGDGNRLGSELTGTESHLGGDFVYTHSTPNNSIIVQVIHTGFLEVNRPASTGVGNQTVTILLEPEGNL